MGTNQALGLILSDNSDSSFEEKDSLSDTSNPEIINSDSSDEVENSIGSEHDNGNFFISYSYFLYLESSNFVSKNGKVMFSNEPYRITKNTRTHIFLANPGPKIISQIDCPGDAFRLFLISFC